MRDLILQLSKSSIYSTKPGHSYVTPPAGLKIDDGMAWYEQVVETEICPLLAEYWFDAPEKVQDSRKELLSV
ncbi:hypothetical protein AWS25_23235 [Enterobacter hormaechei subsp. xiangfangensis]|nr:hypothetical protein AWS25_23235 [Enterobacter hormaechei subsp. xiangfangensis]